MLDCLRALFSQVNDGLRDMFPDSRGAQPFLPDSVHDRVEALPDACQPNERFHFREAVQTATMSSEEVVT